MNLKPFIPLVIATAILAVAAGIYGFGYYRLSKGEAKVIELAKQIDTKSLEMERIAKAQATLTTLTADEEALRAYTVDTNDIVAFLERLQSAGAPFGATVEVVSVTQDRAALHNRVTTALSISGSFDAVLRTLGTIEYAPYDGVLTSVNFDTPADAKGRTWTANVIYSVGLAAPTSKKP